MNCAARDANTSGGDEVSASATPVPTTSCSEFRSARIESTMASRSEFETELEFRTAHSKVHWSELSHKGASGSREQSGMDHLQYFEKLQIEGCAFGGPFCSGVRNVVLERKLGERAQADIYDAQVTFVKDDDRFGCMSGYVVKVMKGDCTLEDLQRQWPHLGIVTSNIDGPKELYPSTVKNHICWFCMGH